MCDPGHTRNTTFIFGRLKGGGMEKGGGMDFEQTIAGARDAITVRRVYGDPIERDGITVIPAAAIGGGAGGGGGEDDKGQRGGGSGFGLGARPVGAYVIDDRGVRWEAAIDVTSMALRGQVVVGCMLLLLVLLRVRRGGG
jgi:uncharacterized spore protein YtfJ